MLAAFVTQSEGQSDATARPSAWYTGKRGPRNGVINTPPRPGVSAAEVIIASQRSRTDSAAFAHDDRLNASRRRVFTQQSQTSVAQLLTDEPTKPERSRSQRRHNTKEASREIVGQLMLDHGERPLTAPAATAENPAAHPVAGGERFMKRQLRPADHNELVNPFRSDRHRYADVDGPFRSQNQTAQLRSQRTALGNQRPEGPRYIPVADHLGGVMRHVAPQQRQQQQQLDPRPPTAHHGYAFADEMPRRKRFVRPDCQYDMAGVLSDASHARARDPRREFEPPVEHTYGQARPATAVRGTRSSSTPASRRHPVHI